MGERHVTIFGKSIGVIGVGTIGGTIVKTLIKNEVFEPRCILGSTSREETAKEVKEKLGIETTTDNDRLVKKSDIIVLSVEPKAIKTVLRGVNSFTPDKTIISVAAGITTQFIESRIDCELPVIRTMPNMALTVNAGATGIVPGAFAKEEDLDLAKKIFEPAGVVEIIREEELMDAITGFSGSGPAYGYLIIESLIEAGVRVGLPREKATRLAAQSLLGAAKMVLETHEHPGRLKDMVTTPAGVTVDAIKKLEEEGVRVAFFNAIEEATNKSRQLKKEG